MRDLLVVLLVAATITIPWWLPRWSRWLDSRLTRARAARRARADAEVRARRGAFRCVKFPGENQ